MTIKIENIGEKHKEGLYYLVESVNQVDNLSYSLTDEWLDHIVKSQSQSVFLAVSEEKVLAMANCMINQMDDSHAMINIVVDPQYRRQGIGGRLYNELISYGEDKGVKVVESYIKKRLDASLSFAKKRGFKTVLYVWKLDLDVSKPRLELIKLDNSLSFRQAKLDDSKSYRGIINEAFDDVLDEGSLERILKDPSVKVYMLEKDGQAIGSVTMQERSNLSVGYIYDVAVMKEHRGQGIGGYMLEKCIEELRLSNIDTATLTVAGDNKQALGLYHKVGFKEVDMDVLGRIII